MGLSPKSNYEKKKSFLVLTSGKFLEALGRGIGTGSIFCLSFSLSNRVSNVDIFTCVEFELTCAGLSEIEGGGAIVHRLCIADIEVKPIP